MLKCECVKHECDFDLSHGLVQTTKHTQAVQAGLCQHQGSWKDSEQMRQGGMEDEADGKWGIIMSRDINFFVCLKDAD